MIYAECKREQHDGSDYYTLRWLVYNGDIIGSYGVHFNGDRPYGSSRDYHRIATEAEIEARAKLDAFNALDDDEQEAAYAAGNEPDYVMSVDQCCYHDNKLCICDGSGLVEVTTDDKRAYMIAAMMAEV